MADLPAALGTTRPRWTTRPGERAGRHDVDVKVHSVAGEVFFEVTMNDAWVWDMYRPARFVKNVKVLTFKDVNVEELATPELDVSKSGLTG